MAISNITKNRNTTSFHLLTIAIPTYNQPDALEKTLKSILTQITPEVEILVCDDSPDSNTREVVQRYQNSFPIRYFKGEQKGVDGALLLLLKEALGEYVWWLGDDVLADGAITRVVKLVKDFPEISFIWVNSCNINNKNDTAFKLEGDKFFNNRNQLLEKDIGMLGFISSTIFKKEKALSGMENSKKYIGSAFVSLYLILHVLSQEGKFYFLSNPYILAKPKFTGESRWYDPFLVFGINLYKIVYEFRDKFDKRLIKKALADNFGKVWRAVLIERALGFTTGFGSKTPKLKQMFTLYWSFPEFWLALPFFIMPRFVLRIFYKFYKILSRKRPFLFNFI